MKKWKKGFSIIIALWIVLIITLIAFYIFEYIIPFSKNVKGIENATKSYYLALSWEEDALFFIKNEGIWAWKIKSFSSTTDFAYNIVSTWTIFPLPWYGTSDFDKDWSKLALDLPIQIYLPASTWGWNLSNIKLYLRVPNFVNWGNLELINTWALIHWQLSSKDAIINADETNKIEADNICSSDISSTCSPISVSDMGTGFLLDNTPQKINDFYNDHCNNDYECVLKLNVLQWFIARNVGKTSVNALLYIEYKFDFGGKAVPRNIIQIKVKGRSFWFMKDLDIYYPQRSLIDAYNFTVFQ